MSEMQRRFVLNAHFPQQQRLAFGKPLSTFPKGHEATRETTPRFVHTKTPTMTKSSCLSYPRPESFQTWTPINPRPLLPIQPPPLQGLALPPLPSPTREAAFGPAYTLATHLVPSAFPRSSADIPQPQVPAHETKEERKARVARVAKEMLALKERQEAGESLGEGSRAVLWNSLNRYVRNGVGGQERHTQKKHLTLFLAHANGMHKEVGSMHFAEFPLCSCGSFVDL